LLPWWVINVADALIKKKGTRQMSFFVGYYITNPLVIFEKRIPSEHKHLKTASLSMHQTIQHPEKYKQHIFFFFQNFIEGY
jgi:hypothetical protein